MTTAGRECRYCAEPHGSSLLCGPAKTVLDALYARGMRFDMPAIEFPEPLTHAGAFGAGTVVCRQVVVKAGVTEVAGVARPVLILTGQDLDGNVLPEWLYPADDEDLRRLVKLVTDMGEMAIRRARDQRRKGAS